MELICFTGMDGAGKTTLARKLVNTLKREGKSAVYIYGRTYPIVSRLLMALGRVFFLRKHNQWRAYQLYTTNKKQTMRNPLLTWIYTAAILVDYYVQIWFKLLPHLMSQKIVVSDRYVYDTIISDLAAHLEYSPAQTKLAIEQGLAWLPMPRLTILLDLSEETAFSRKTDIPHIDYLRERRIWYQQLVSRPEIKQLNGENELEPLHKTVVKEFTQAQLGER